MYIYIYIYISHIVDMLLVCIVYTMNMVQYISVTGQSCIFTVNGALCTVQRGTKWALQS